MCQKIGTGDRGGELKKKDFFLQEKITQGSMEDSTYRSLGGVGVAWREVKEGGDSRRRAEHSVNLWNKTLSV